MYRIQPPVIARRCANSDSAINRRRIRFPRFMLAFVLLLGPAPAWAWGATGHKLACGIAYQLLGKSQQQAVDRLLKAYRTPDGRSFRYFSQACVLADIARGRARDGRHGWKRFERFDNWHFINLPRSAKKPLLKHCGAGCVHQAIEFHRGRFADTSLSENERAEALFMLGHWIADAHQPMHVSFADDRGGNRVRIINTPGVASHNMHQLWDTELVDNVVNGRKWWQYAARLADSIKPKEKSSWANGDALTWIAESYDITIAPRTRYCSWKRGWLTSRCEGSKSVSLNSDYLNRHSSAVLRRLRQSGYRIAMIISTAPDAR